MRSEPAAIHAASAKTGRVIASRPLSESVQGCTKTISSSAISVANSAPPMRSHVFCMVAPRPGWATITQLSMMVWMPCQSAAV